MKTSCLVLLVCFHFFFQLNAQVYPSLNISLLAHIDPEKDNTGSDGRKYSGCWGWYQAAKNKEYAIVGTSSQTYFIDVTNPSSPVVLDSVKAKHTGCTWREVKTYKQYCYVVSDECLPNSFQIIDMSYLPDSVHVVHDDTSIFERCHTIFVDNDHLYCGSVREVGGSSSSMRVYSLATPTAPTLIRKLETDIPTSIIGVVHDMFVRNDTVYASGGNSGFHILKLLPSNTFSLLATYSGYVQSGYNHSSWQTDNRKTMVFADEVPAGLCVKVIDVHDFDNISLLDTVRSHLLATAHNPYIMGNNWCWISSYQDGLYLYDISNPANTTIYGYFDTQPEHGVNDNFSFGPYRGNWGAYPFLPSKIIIACDMQNGIFILNGDGAYRSSVGINESNTSPISFSMYPNPVNSELHFIIANKNSKHMSYCIKDMLGKTIEEHDFNIDNDLYKTSIHINHIPNGCYMITLKENSVSETKKIIIQR